MNPTFCLPMKTWPDKKCAWLALYTVQGLGNQTFKNLLDKFGEPEDVFEARLAELAEVEGVRKDIARRIVNREFSLDPVTELKKVERCNARIITYQEPTYPGLLKEISSPPMILYVKGQPIPPDLTFIAVVGSRNATHYGLAAAEKIGIGLSNRGVGVVSGMAKGIDSAAHWGCLRGQGFTIAVIGTGIDVVYPASNRDLLARVIENGVVISEFPTGTPPEPKNFPIRNRIISGLSRGVVVVEATRRSGSLITASMALDQGREVFAVPGSIDSFKSTGAHFLIKQGARLVENADDILDELGFFGRELNRTTASGGVDTVSVDMDEPETRVYSIIGDYPIHVDNIVRLGGLDAGEVLGILMRLELKGIIRQLPGKMFVRYRV